MTSGESFGNVKRYLDEIGDCPRILVGNKCEDPERRVVLEVDALRFAEQMNIGFFETSAKDNINVDEMFTAVTRLALENQQGGIQLTSGRQRQKSGCRKCH